MGRSSNRMVFGTIALFVSIVAIGFVYAGFTGTLNINGTAGVTASKWDIYFANLSNAVTTGRANEIEAPTIKTKTSIGDYLVEFNDLGDSVTYTFDVVNDGNFDALLTVLTITPPACSGGDATSNEVACNNLEYTLKYTASGKEVKENDPLLKGETKNMTLKLAVKNNGNLSGVTRDVTIGGLGIQMMYSQASGYNGQDSIIPEPKTLYSVLENEYNNNTGFAKLYSGSHQDSMDASKSTSNIYYWYGSSDANGTAILNKNNVVFAQQCWQMIRTTDTGGVRMIYNGEAVNNQCLNTRGTHIGYASRISQSLSSNYWYGTDYTYDSTNKVFSISGTTEQTRWNATTGPGLVGKYTCKGTTETGTCSTLYLVESYYNTSSGYVIPLNSSSNYSQFGTLQINVNKTSPADVGYMYNTRYTYNSKTMTNTETILLSSSLGTTYWYANSITWGTPTANKYNLDNPYQVSATTDYPNLVGEYTFRNATQTYTNTTVQYIAAVNNTTYYYIQLGNETGTTHDLNYYNYTYTYGTSYTDNGNGTYTINNPTTIERKNWYTSYSNVGSNKYVCKNATNDTCIDLWYTT